MKSFKITILLSSLALGLLFISTGCGEAGKKNLKADANQYVIKGNLQNADSMLMMVLRFLPGQPMPEVDSVWIEKGQFEYAGKADSTKMELIVLSFENAFAKQAAMGAQIDERMAIIQLVVKNNETFELEGDASNARTIKIGGSALAKDFGDYRKATDSLEATLMTMNDSLQMVNKGQQPTDAQISVVMDRAQQLQNATIVDFMKQHSNSELSLYILEYDLLAQQPDPAVVSESYKSLSPELQNSASGKRVKEMVERLSAISIGNIAPDFTVNDMDGKPFQLSQTRGKYVLLDFWASWCRPCRAENPNLVTAYNKYKGKGFEIVSFSIDESEMKWREAVSQDKLNWKQVGDQSGWRAAAAQNYFVTSIPANYLLDKEGRIIASNLRGPALEKKLAELLK